MGSSTELRASPCPDDQWGCGCLFVLAWWPRISIETFRRPQEAPPGSARTDQTAVARGASGRLCVSLFELPRSVSCLEATVKSIRRLEETTWHHGVLRDERHQVHPLRLQSSLRDIWYRYYRGRSVGVGRCWRIQSFHGRKDNGSANSAYSCGVYRFRHSFSGLLRRDQGALQHVDRLRGRAVNNLRDRAGCRYCRGGVQERFQRGDEGYLEGVDEELHGRRQGGLGQRAEKAAMLWRGWPFRLEHGIQTLSVLLLHHGHAGDMSVRQPDHVQGRMLQQTGNASHEGRYGLDRRGHRDSFRGDCRHCPRLLPRHGHKKGR